ncbi:MAG: PHP domain-containing protein [Labilithrix sp.]|nr:PHP domain-containing protein [Labilithrix sp.]MCW5810293.1 PHP domain-containing protein [Labilithrix sp.]
MRVRWGGAIAWGLVAIVAASGAKGCSAREGCLAGDDGSCKPAAACTKLAFPACDDGRLVVRHVASSAERAAGADALATRGDVLLANDRVQIVLDAIGAPHALAPTGGNVIDLSAGASGDTLNLLYHAVGVLPRDAVAYRSVELEDAAPDHVAVILRGTLDGRPEMTVVSRYELRACEPGVRVRTELFHGGREPDSFFLADAVFWGSREASAFTPLRGRGFVHPDIDLEKLGDALAEEPFFAAQAQNDSDSAYALVPCDRLMLEAFHSSTVTASGSARRVVLPGDGVAYERFLAVAPGPGLGGAADVALQARASLFGEASVVMRGRVRANDGGTIEGGQRHATLLFYEPAPGANPDAPAGRRPWSTVVPAADGTFSVRLPAQRSLRAEVLVLGRPIPEHAAFATGASDGVVPDIVVPRSGVLDVVVHDGSGQPVLAEVVLTPVEGADPDATRGSLFGAVDVEHCAPWLGPAHGASPACNRALTYVDGAVGFAVPTGTFWVYATRGPFATLARSRVEIRPGARASVELAVDTLPGLVPDGVLGADFHVHGGASFDSSLPDRDRARTFVAGGLDVIAATDHDVVTNYASSLRTLGIEDRVVVMPGVETTGQILFYEPPGFGLVPRVIGHYNFWPLPYDPELPRNGAPWDERLEPGALFDVVAALSPERGVAQMNHPFSPTTLGRDEGFLNALHLDVREPARSNAELTRRSAGGRTALDYDTQEVMNGTSTKQFHQYRVAWHAFLSQGILRAGTANSDSHTLAVEVLGYPRNLVFGGHSVAAFDRPRFNADVRAGRMIGTNGPIVLATIEGRGPSLEAFAPGASAALAIEVRAAPWIPVEEVRVLVNGAVARTIGGGAIARPADPFGKDGLVRYRGSVPLAELLAAVPSEEDAWIVVEAGLPLVPVRDLDDDGLPETTDNDGNSVIDESDRADGYREPPRPRESEARFHAYAIANGHWSAAFTNPFLIDRRGDGWKAPAR